MPCDIFMAVVLRPRFFLKHFFLESLVTFPLDFHCQRRHISADAFTSNQIRVTLQTSNHLVLLQRQNTVGSAIRSKKELLLQYLSLVLITLPFFSSVRPRIIPG
jgi:hypothetical protein